MEVGEEADEVGGEAGAGGFVGLGELVGRQVVVGAGEDEGRDEAHFHGLVLLGQPLEDRVGAEEALAPLAEGRVGLEEAEVAPHVGPVAAVSEVLGDVPVEFLEGRVEGLDVEAPGGEAPAVLVGHGGEAEIRVEVLVLGRRAGEAGQEALHVVEIPSVVAGAAEPSFDLFDGDYIKHGSRIARIGAAREVAGTIHAPRPGS